MGESQKISQLDALLDGKLIAHLDFDFQFVCEIGRRSTRTCGKPATFMVRCRGCAHSWLVCAGHRQAYRELAGTYDRVRCEHCGREAQSVDDLLQFFPIGGN